MQLINAPVNEAIVSNVAEIGEFRIRNSAKAFSILSSGLYANKIKAIIRELSCNAVDSHVAAGRADVPFDVHLPTQFEPWFAIRDYGTGLNHEQVTNIYTTYFESTKTNSNDYIGALGLGSKSPFAYTDNFTVTAVKDGQKGIYSAFINDQGVPSIALMATEVTDEPAGVEVKFSVNDRWDFDKFYYESRAVYKWFKLRPVVTSSRDFVFEDPEFKERDIIPGVHVVGNRSANTAIMGNIAYPIEMPASNDLGSLEHLLHCGLVMEFAIGELDFQASREGLSYIPQTIEAIKRKLEAVNAVLVDKLAAEANLITNNWERATFLVRKADMYLYRAAIAKYIADTGFDFVDTSHSTIRAKTFRLVQDDLKKFNIQLRAFEKRRGEFACSTVKSYTDFAMQNRPLMIDVTASAGAHFVVNDTKIGALERAKHHWRNATIDYTESSYHTVFVIEPVDRTKPVNEKAFFKLLGNPPAQRILKASDLLQKQRIGGSGNGMAKDVTIMKLEKKGYGGYYTQRELVWRDAGKSSTFDDNDTFYYLPLSGFNLVSNYGFGSGVELHNLLRDCGLTNMPTTFYGVRKGDIEDIKKRANWINIEEYVAERVAKLTAKDVIPCLFKAVDYPNTMRYNADIVSKVDPKSLYATVVNEFKDIRAHDGDKHAMIKLLTKFNSAISVESVIQKYRDTVREVTSRYPLLPHIQAAGDTEIANYINLIDQSKGI